MRRPEFFAIVIIVILGLLANESTGQQQKLPTLPPAPPVTWSPFNINPDGTITRRIERVMYLLYPSLRKPLVTYETHMWLKTLPSALFEVYALGITRIHDFVYTFSQLVTLDDLQYVIKAAGRLSPRFELLGAVSASANRALSDIEDLSGDDRQKRIDKIVVECLLRAGYQLKDREGYPEFKITSEEAWTFIMAWMVHYPSGDDVEAY